MKPEIFNTTKLDMSDLQTWVDTVLPILNEAVYMVEYKAITFCRVRNPSFTDPARHLYMCSHSAFHDHLNVHLPHPVVNTSIMDQIADSVSGKDISVKYVTPSWLTSMTETSIRTWMASTEPSHRRRVYYYGRSKTNLSNYCVQKASEALEGLTMRVHARPDKEMLMKSRVHRAGLDLRRARDKQVRNAWLAEYHQRRSERYTKTCENLQAKIDRNTIRTNDRNTDHADD